MANPSYFANSHGFVIESGGNFATVNGNQIINYFNREPERKTALTIYDQFRQVIQGDINRTKDFGVSTYPRRWDRGEFKRWEERSQCLRADKTICAAQVVGVEGRVFTVVSYTGPEAREAFEKDFQTFSTTITATSFQVYGINTHIPTVLFYDERQPAANFLDSLGFWGKLYLESLRIRQFCCCQNEIWMDVKKGVLCRGPAGPDCEIPVDYFAWENLSCSAELLRDDNCLCFLASLKSKVIDRSVVNAIAEHGTLVSEVEVHQLAVFSTLTNAIIAVGDGSWEKTPGSCIGEREVMEDGGTRFTLLGEGGQIRQNHFVLITGEWEAWVSQASSVFHRRGVSLDDDLGQYELVFPDLALEGYLSEFSETLHHRRREKPIYLFVRLPPTSTPFTPCMTSSFHYWSFDPTGQCPLPAEICEHLGLPIELPAARVWTSHRYRWNNEQYKWMHQYQLARGFDPTTPSFARSCGYPIYQVQSDSDRFEDLGSAKNTRKGLWSKWSWAASEGSNIPAFGM